MFNIRLKDLRKSRKLTQKQVAAGIEISERRYIDLETGKYQPSFETLRSLCEYFQCSSDYLLGLSDNPDSHKS